MDKKLLREALQIIIALTGQNVTKLNRNRCLKLQEIINTLLGEELLKEKK